jgi:putative FmdB family regulatory protein
MPIYPYHCQECNELWDELLSFNENPKECPACGETKNFKRMIGVPQRPKVQSGKPQERWGYNKTTTDYLFDGSGRRMAHQYDENKQNAQRKEFADKIARKGATVMGSSIKKSKKTTKK